MLEAIRDLLSAPPPDRDQAAYVKELEHRLSLIDHAVDRVLCEEPQAMADFLRNAPKLEGDD